MMTSATTAVSRKFFNLMVKSTDTIVANAIPTNLFRYKRHSVVLILSLFGISFQSRILFACKVIPSVPYLTLNYTFAY